MLQHDPPEGPPLSAVHDRLGLDKIALAVIPSEVEGPAFDRKNEKPAERTPWALFWISRELLPLAVMIVIEELRSVFFPAHRRFFEWQRGRLH